MQKIKGTVILDIDDVATATNDKVVDTYNNEYEDKITRKDIIRFRYSECPNIKNKIVHFFERPGFFKDLKPAERVVEGVKKLVDEGYDVVFATNTCRQGARDRIEWVLENFPFVPEKNIIIIGRKDLLYGDWFLDDCIDNIITNRCTNRVIMNAEWNTEEQYPESKGFKRVDNFSEFVELVLNSN